LTIEYFKLFGKEVIKMLQSSNELKELTHTALKMYVPKEMYDYICGMIDMAHMMNVIGKTTSINNSSIKAEETRKES